jgi:hypothetical protein
VNLHIVRNHGAVPRIQWETHRIAFSGNVPKPFSIGMDELVAMPTVGLYKLIDAVDPRSLKARLVSTLAPVK